MLFIYTRILLKLKITDLYMILRQNHNLWKIVAVHYFTFTLICTFYRSFVYDYRSCSNLTQLRNSNTDTSGEDNFMRSADWPYKIFFMNTNAARAAILK